MVKNSQKTIGTHSNGTEGVHGVREKNMLKTLHILVDSFVSFEGLEML
jgi:hypothetical protein